jgi:arginyl-tRNA synthetase
MPQDNPKPRPCEDPYEAIVSECRGLLRRTLAERYPELQDTDIKFEEPPSPQLGDLSTVVCFQVSKIIGVPAKNVAEEIAGAAKLNDDSIVESIAPAGAGYLNVKLNYRKVNELTLHSIRTLRDNYGFPRTETPEEILLEHSSINPVHSIHIGQARNSILGDAIARILRARGHKVEVHFYVNDAGRQSAIVAYGYQKLGQPEVRAKPDRYIGEVYSITSCLVEIQSLKRRLKDLTSVENKEQERKDTQERLNEWVADALELQNHYPDLFEQLRKEINLDPDSDTMISDLLREYEAQEESAARLFRRVSELCINGFKQTFSKLNIGFDAWDWESDLLWSGRVSEVLDTLLKTKYAAKQDGALKLDSGLAVEELGIRQLLNIGEDYVLPPVSLTRSDGTTLYIARDIAYSLSKFDKHSLVINVVGMEQLHEQLHVRVALAILGQKKMATKQSHFTFGLVKFPGERMSSRRGRIIALDDVVDEAIKRAYLEIEKRNPGLPPEEEQALASAIGVGAVKYTLLAVEPSREVEFSWDRVLNLEANSAPFINYGYTRARGILKKTGTTSQNPDYSTLNDPLDKRLVLTLARFPSVFSEAADRLRPDDLAGYANQLTKQFHEYYERVDVSHLKDAALKNSRASLVESVQIVIRNCMGVLGIELSEKM